MCGGYNENVLPEYGALPRILGKVEDYSFKEKYNRGEGDHFPLVLNRTLKYCDMQILARWCVLDNTLTLTIEYALGKSSILTYLAIESPLRKIKEYV